MLSEVCAYLHNWFDMDDDHKALPSLKGTFTIADGTIELSSIVKDGQYFRIQNSIFNDGVYQYPAKDLTDETFTGKITAMKIPSGLIALCAEIGKWMEKYGAYDSTANSPYSGESFGGYSYSKPSGSGGTEGGTAPQWAAVFGGRLAKWRKI